MNDPRDFYLSPWILVLPCLFVYSLTSYGGIRSTDSEIVFRTAQSIAKQGSFSVSEGVLWERFGLAEGKDGRSYSIFGPTQSIMLVPFVKLGELVNSSDWYLDPPLDLHPSHQVGEGLFHYIGRVRPVDLEPHALRVTASSFNVFASVLVVMVFWYVLRALGYSAGSSTLTAALLAFGSLLWPYSGTLFSEPLATLLVLTSFLLLLRGPREGPGFLQPGVSLFISGLLLGVAVTVHITAVLFFPFFLLLTGGKDGFKGVAWSEIARAALLFTLGFSLPVALLGNYNHMRFGSIFETGRGVDSGQANRLFYGRFTWPFMGLYGLLFGGAKGLFVTSPSTVAGVFSWRYFKGRSRYLATIVASMVMFRVLFIASRTDWHGGYSLGPRYLVMIIPFLLIPVASFLDRPSGPRTSRPIMVASAVAMISVQLHFVLGEIFTFYNLIKLSFAPYGIAALPVPYPYLQWRFSPLLSLPGDYRGAWLLEVIPLSNKTVWIVGTFLLVPIVWWVLSRVHFRGDDKTM